MPRVRWKLENIWWKSFGNVMKYIILSVLWGILSATMGYTILDFPKGFFVVIIGLVMLAFAFHGEKE